MADLAERLLAEAEKLEAMEKSGISKNISGPIQRLRDAANQVACSWSGSWLGYQSRVYYADFQPTPAGAHFSIEWGRRETFSQGTRGHWVEYTFDVVRDSIFSEAGVRSLAAVEKLADRAGAVFANSQEEFLSIATIALENRADSFLSRLKEQVEKMRISTKFDLARALQPTGKFMSRDSIAIGQGFQTPPHVSVMSELIALENAPAKCGELAKILHRAASHLRIRGQHQPERQDVGTNVFLGHGRSPVWKDLKDFVHDRLGLPWDEFNRVPIAGITNISRLSEMLDHSAIAFVVMTAEDEQIDGTIRARENVIHEAGLFQGKLGFTKAILLLEEGCEEFSNIHGLGQIRFPKGNIKAAFEEVRLVLEREGIAES
jgi:predicted nucleotide-binding protein